MTEPVDVQNVGVILTQFGPGGSRTIGISADPDLIREVAQTMAREYLRRLAEPGTPSAAIEEGRIKVLDAIGSATFTDDEGEPIAKPVWWDALSSGSEEVSSSQP